MYGVLIYPQQNFRSRKKRASLVWIAPYWYKTRNTTPIVSLRQRAPRCWLEEPLATPPELQPITSRQASCHHAFMGCQEQPTICTGSVGYEWNRTGPHRGTPSGANTYTPGTPTGVPPGSTSPSDDNTSTPGAPGSPGKPGAPEVGSLVFVEWPAVIAWT